MKGRFTLLIPFVPAGHRAVERIFGCNYGSYPMPNIFQLYAGSVLEATGFDVKIVDAPLDKWTESDFRHFLETDNSIGYVVYSTLLARDMDVAAHSILRQIKPDVPMIYIGSAPTDDPAYYLPDENSFVIRGEPELALPKLATLISSGLKADYRQMLNEIPSLSFKKGSDIQNNPFEGIIENLDLIPHPARHLVDPKKYFSPKFGVSPVTVMLTSRGCTAKCIYCVPCSLSFAREIEYKKNTHKKPPVRMRSTENVIEEIELIAKEGYKAVSIIDDQFIWGDKRTVAIAEAFKKHGLVWGCLARPDMITDNIAKALGESNCRFVDLGVESFDPKVLEYVGKDIAIDQIENAIRLLKKYRVFVKANILLGSSPLETKESIRHTIERAIELGVDSIMVGATNPFPGTEFYEMAKSNGWFIKGDYYPTDSQREWVMEYPNFSREDMDEMLRWANRRFFLRPTFFFKQIHRLKNPSDFARTVATFFKKLSWTWQ